MNEKEWLQWRHKGIGGSDAPIIMGVSRFKTAYELWEQKIKPEPPEQQKNFITEKGHKLEAIARKNYELETFCNWPAKMVEWEQNKRMRCSLDGWNDGRVWECKYLGWDKFNALKDGVIPKEYYPQIMYQCMITGSMQVHLTGIVDEKVKKSLKPGETEQYTLVHDLNQEDLNYIASELLPRIEQFISCVDTKTPPPKSDSDVEDFSNNHELKNLLMRYFANKKILDRAKKDEDKLKKLIFEKINGCKKAICGSYKMTKSITKASQVPDYEQYCKANGIQVNIFKDKKERVTHRISFLD